jgi:hypothetical protein
MQTNYELRLLEQKHNAEIAVVPPASIQTPMLKAREKAEGVCSRLSSAHGLRVHWHISAATFGHYDKWKITIDAYG